MTYYRQLAKTLVQAGAKVTVVEGSGFGTANNSAFKVIEGVSVYSIKPLRFESWLRKFDHLRSMPTLRSNLAAAWASWELAQEHGPFDVVEATEFGLLMVPAILDHKFPVVTQMHASAGQIQGNDPVPGEELSSAISLAIETAAVRLSSSTQTYSMQNKAFWDEQCGGKQVDLLLPPFQISVPQSEGNEIRQAISVFGRIQLWKGPRIVSEALRELPDIPIVNWYGRDIVGSALGPGSTSEALRLLYPETWGSRIVTHEPVPPEIVQALQSTSLLNLIPSTWDVFNFTVVEAMSSGRPVVCSDCAGASELIEDGVTGFLYDGKSAKSLANTLRRALQTDPKRIIAIGSDARKKIAHELDPVKIARERLAAYQGVIDAHSETISLPEWFKQIAMPRKLNRSGYEFLNKLPLRPIAGHVLNRLAAKVGLKR
jgi:glycosyltransferase involved in cell wall biosynthesis